MIHCPIEPLNIYYVPLAWVKGLTVLVKIAPYQKIKIANVAKQINPRWLCQLIITRDSQDPQNHLKQKHRSGPALVFLSQTKVPSVVVGVSINAAFCRYSPSPKAMLPEKSYASNTSRSVTSWPMCIVVPSARLHMITMPCIDVEAEESTTACNDIQEVF